MRLCAAIVLVSLPPLAAPLTAQSADSLRHTFQVMAPEMNVAHGNIEECTERAPEQFVSLLEALAKEQNAQQELTVKVQASLTTDDSPKAANPEQLDVVSDSSPSLMFTQDHAATAGLQLNRGTYPGELSFSTEVGLTLDDDTNGFRENISRVRASYDHYFYPFLESYVFFDRLSNDFLSIDQRYEAGLGIVFDVYPAEKGPLPPVGNGADIQRALALDPYDPAPATGASESTSAGDDDASSGDAGPPGEQGDAGEGNGSDEDDENERPSWLTCYVKTRLIMAGHDTATVKAYKPDNEGWAGDDRVAARAADMYAEEGERAARTVDEELVAARVSAVKRHARLRPAILFGVDTEFEQATLHVALDDSTKFAVPLRGTQTYRLVIRPTLVLRINEHMSVRGDWYFMRRIAGFDGSVGDDDDVRRDLRIAGTVDGDLSGIGKLSVTLEFRRLEDLAPPYIDRAGSTIADGVTLDDRLVELLGPRPLFARGRHDRVQLKVGVTF